MDDKTNSEYNSIEKDLKENFGSSKSTNSIDDDVTLSEETPKVQQEDKTKKKYKKTGLGVAAGVIGLSSIPVKTGNAINNKNLDNMDKMRPITIDSSENGEYPQEIEPIIGDSSEVNVGQDSSSILPCASSVNDSMSFKEAFANARSELGAGGLFVWHGKPYGTYYENELKTMTLEEKEQWRADARSTIEHLEHADDQGVVAETRPELEAISPLEPIQAEEVKLSNDIVVDENPMVESQLLEVRIATEEDLKRLPMVKISPLEPIQAEEVYLSDGIVDENPVIEPQLLDARIATDDDLERLPMVDVSPLEPIQAEEIQLSDGIVVDENPMIALKADFDIGINQDEPQFVQADTETDVPFVDSDVEFAHVDTDPSGLIGFAPGLPVYNGMDMSEYFDNGDIGDIP